MELNVSISKATDGTVVPSEQQVIVIPSSATVSELNSIEDTIMYNVLHSKFSNMPKSLIEEEFSLILKMKLIHLFISREYITNSIDIDTILAELECGLMPLVKNYIKYILSIDMIGTRQLSLIMNEVSDLVYSYVKLEFIRHSLVFDDEYIRNYIDGIFEYMSKRIKGESVKSPETP